MFTIIHRYRTHNRIIHRYRTHNRGTILVMFTLTMLMSSTLACVSESQQGELPADCVPITISLQGEIDPTWAGDVVAAQTYQLHIESQKYPVNQLAVMIYAIEENGRTLIAESRGAETEEQLTISFTGPDSERILIKLIARTGADGEDLGQFSIKLCKG